MYSRSTLSRRSKFPLSWLVSALLLGGVAVAVLLIASDRSQSDDFQLITGAAQYIYQQGVPHTDAQGRLLGSYDPDQSFLPRGLYHTVVGNFYGRQYSLAPLQQAGFNCFHLWEGIRVTEVISEAEQEDLQVIIHNPRPEEVAQFADSDRILGWYLDEEPTGKYWGQDMDGKFAEFQQRYQEIRQVDTTHPIFPLDASTILSPRTQWWLKWNDAGDLSAHDNYPFKPGTYTLDTARGVPASIGMALRATGEKKPVWFLAQGFANDGRKGTQWVMPTPQQMRCQTYTAFIHGATGILYFTYDSWMTRNAGIMGVAPDPPADYGTGPQERYLANQMQINRSQALWQTLRQLNQELAELKPVLFAPTDRMMYRVYVRGPHVSDAPLRALLKECNGEYYLLAVNLEGQPLQARFEFPRFLESAEMRFSDRPLDQIDTLTLTDSFDAWDVRIYKLDFM